MLDLSNRPCFLTLRPLHMEKLAPVIILLQYVVETNLQPKKSWNLMQSTSREIGPTSRYKAALKLTSNCPTLVIYLFVCLFSVIMPVAGKDKLGLSSWCRIPPRPRTLTEGLLNATQSILSNNYYRPWYFCSLFFISCPTVIQSCSRPITSLARGAAHPPRASVQAPTPSLPFSFNFCLLGPHWSISISYPIGCQVLCIVWCVKRKTIITSVFPPMWIPQPHYTKQDI